MSFNLVSVCAQNEINCLSIALRQQNAFLTRRIGKNILRCCRQRLFDKAHKPGNSTHVPIHGIVAPGRATTRTRFGCIHRSLLPDIPQRPRRSPDEMEDDYSVFEATVSDLKASGTLGCSSPETP